MEYCYLRTEGNKTPVSGHAKLPKGQGGMIYFPALVTQRGIAATKGNSPQRRRELRVFGLQKCLLSPRLCGEFSAAV